MVEHSPQILASEEKVMNTTASTITTTLKQAVPAKQHNFV